MKIEPWLSLRVAPRFHNGMPWQERLRLNGGVDRSQSAFFPRNDWRALDSDELRILLDGDGSQTDGHLSLITAPPHLRAAWWAAAEHADAAVDDDKGYRAFVGELTEFLRFKQLPLGNGCRLDVIASRPGQSSTRLAAGGTLAGLAWSVTADGKLLASRVVSVINLGDEATHLVFLNLSPGAIGARLAPPLGSAPRAAAAELLEEFFTASPVYPLVRLRLEPGDGLWLPACGVVYDGWTHDKDDVDLVLTIRSA
jgi:hypothetical protein